MQPSSARATRTGAIAIVVLVAIILLYAVHRTLPVATTPARSSHATADATEADAHDARRPINHAPRRATETETAGAVRESQRIRDAVEHHLRALARDGDPRQRVIALQLLLAGSADVAARRNARAVAARLFAESPHDEVLALAQTWFCGGSDPCTDAERDAWARVAPGNAAAQLASLPAAAGEPRRIDAMLAAAAHGDRFDGGLHTLQLETMAALENLTLPPAGPYERRLLRQAGLDVTDEERRRHAIGSYMLALPMSNIAAPTRACRPPVAAQRGRDCYAVFRRMAGSTSLIERGVALSMLEQLTRGTAENATWLSRMRDGRWQLDRYSRLEVGATYWRDVERFGEVGAVQRALQRAGIPLHAPPGWR